MYVTDLTYVTYLTRGDIGFQTFHSLHTFQSSAYWLMVLNDQSL